MGLGRPVNRRFPKAQLVEVIAGVPDDGLLQGLFPDSVLVADMDPADADANQLFPEERAQIHGAAAVRRQEYAAVRQLARNLLERLGVDRTPLVNGPDHAPIWSEGVTGSLSHTRGRAIAAVVRTTDIAAIGCDIEPDLPLEPDLHPQVMSVSEMRIARSGEPWIGRFFFCAKEATFKAVYMKARRFLGFDAITVEPDFASGGFEATVVLEDARYSVLGRFARSDGFLVTTALIRL